MTTAPNDDADRAGPQISIVRLQSLAGWQARATELDPIFFEASLTKSFADDAARRVFHERWLGRFLTNWPELVHVAVSSGGRLVGYIVGAFVDPARSDRFKDLGFYKHLAHLTPYYPAHLHINLAPDVRGFGIGSRLIRAFEMNARDHMMPGVHLVTGRDSRNRSFYAQNGYRQIAGLIWGDTPIVMLAKTLPSVDLKSLPQQK